MKFIWERDRKKLRLLRKQEGLDKILLGAKNQWEKIRRLNDWAHHQILLAYYGHPIKPMPIDIFNQLELLRSRKSQGWCGNYALIFIQAALSVGIPARCFAIWAVAGDTHTIADAWDRNLKKWITVDPYYNIHYVLGNKHLSVYDLCKLVNKNDIGGVVIRHPLFGDYITYSTFKPDILNYFHNFGLTMRNNFITNPKPISRTEIMHWEHGKSRKKDFFWKVGKHLNREEIINIKEVNLDVLFR